MLPPAFTNTSDSLEAREFEQLIQDGITAVKNGNLSLARRLLEQAALINRADARVWIWLSATTEDLQERRDFLERAVAADPSNAAAKRGLLMLTKKLDEANLIPEGEAYTPPESPAPEIATTKTFTCPNCGANISYEPSETKLVCQFCGFTRKIDELVIEESTEQVLDAVLPTSRAHRWAENQARVCCEQCGAVILLPPGQTADSCPYCGSNRMISSPTLLEMIDPERIGVCKVDQQAVENNVKSWLSKGFFAPDNLASKHAALRLHPAYYPFWIFNGTLEIPWFCDVNESTSGPSDWKAHTGSQFEMFKDIVIPGLRKLSALDVAGIEPFNLSELVEFSPDYLAGWEALTYDLPLADASLRARELVTKRVRAALPGMVEIGHQKRNFSTGSGKWSGLTYKLALLPIYIGNYQFQGKPFRVLVNGQTGQVSGKKPVDNLKIALYTVGGVVLLAIILLVIWLLLRMITS